MAIKLFDGVRVVKNMPDKGIKAGMVGTVVDIYNKPYPAYEVEFCDNQGRTLVMKALLPDEITPTGDITREEYNQRVMPDNKEPI